jgi:GxxExxY protein
MNFQIDELTGIVLDQCLKIHKHIGPGCFERVYEELLNYHLDKKGIKVYRQVMLPLSYEELLIKDAYKLDLLIEDKLIIEVKSLERIGPVHFMQVMTYLKLTNLKNGVLVNFNVDLIKNGFHRVFNNEAV